MVRKHEGQEAVNRWRGFCVACKKDLYTDPARHYVSDSHFANVKRAELAEEKQRKGTK
jgi:hypothetical protein